MAEDALDTLGNDQIARKDAANQLIYDLLVDLAGHQNLLNILEDRITVEQHQMRVYTHGRPEVEYVNR